MAGGRACCGNWTSKLVWNLAFGYSGQLHNKGGLYLCIISIDKNLGHLDVMLSRCSFQPYLF